MEQYKENLHSEMRSITAKDIALYNHNNLILNDEKYVIAAYPNEVLLTKLKRIQVGLLDADKSLLIVPPDQLHISLFSFKTSDYRDSEVVKLISKATVPRFGFEVGGLLYNAHSCFVPCFPLNFSLTDFRKQLRSLFKVDGINYSVYNPIYERIGWFNIARFSKKPSNGFLEMIKDYSEFNLGTLSDARISVLRTKSKILEPNKTLLLFTK